MTGAHGIQFLETGSLVEPAAAAWQGGQIQQGNLRTADVEAERLHVHAAGEIGDE